MPMYRLTLIDLGERQISQDIEMIDDEQAEHEALDQMDVSDQVQFGFMKWVEVLRLPDGS